MILLDSRFVGYDLNIIGFPSVETCMAVVLETNDWLVGWHAMNTSDTSIANDAAAFGGYAAKMGTSAHVHLYGVTHPSRMGKGQLEVQMRAIAGRMNYSGKKISIYQIGTLQPKRRDYVQFTREGGGSPCRVEYLDQDNVKHDEQNIEPARTRHKQILTGKVCPLTTITNQEGGGLAVDTTSPIKTSVNRGNNAMASISKSSWTSFNAA